MQKITPRPSLLMHKKVLPSFNQLNIHVIIAMRTENKFFKAEIFSKK